MTVTGKKYINARPLVFVTLAYIFGLVSALSEYMVLACICSAAAIILLVCLSKSKPVLFIVMAAIYALGFFLIYSGVLEAKYEPDNTPYILTGRICEEVEKTSYGVRAVLDDCVIENDDTKLELDKRVQLDLYAEDGEYKYGMEIKGTVVLSKPSKPQNEAEYDMQTAYLRQGIGYIAYTVYSDELQVTDFRQDVYGYMLDIRSTIRNVIMSSCSDKDSASVIAGMVLGDTDNISSNILGEFRTTGIAHVLSVSGLHVGFVVLILNYLLKKTGMDAQKGFIVLGAVLLVYCVITAMSSSTIRASIMALVLSGSKLGGRKYDSLTSLAAAALLILLAAPLEILSAGFVISFSAVLGIIFTEKHIARRLKKYPNFIASSLSVSLAAQIGIIPSLCVYFNKIPLLGIFVNLLAVPISMLGVVGGLGASIIGLILPNVGALLFHVLEIPISCLIAANSFVSQLPLASVYMPSFSSLFIILYILTVVIFSGFIFINKKYKVIAACVTTAVVLLVQLAVFFTPAPDIKIVMFSVGNADSIYISVGGKKHYLVDTGRYYDTSSIVIPYLSSKGINKLDGIFITHSDIDHSQGLSDITEEIECSHIYVSEYSIPENNEGKYTFEPLGAGDTLDLGRGAAITVLCPSGLVPQSDNDASIVFLLEKGDFSMLFTGDAGDAADPAIINNIDNCTILKASHHGSSTGTSEALLRALAPEAVLISANDSGKLPSDEVVERLGKLDIDYYLTKYTGMITVEVDDGRYSIKTFLGDGNES